MRYKDTGEPVPIVERRGFLPLVGTPEGVKVALPRLIDIILQAGGGAPAVAPAPRAVRVGTQAAGARAARPLINDVIDQSAAEAQVAAVERVAQALPPTRNDNFLMPSQAYFHPPKVRRPFEADYPKGARANEKGRLTVDIDRQEMYPDATTKIIGRVRMGGPDKPLFEKEYNGVLKFLTNDTKAVIREVEPHEMKRPGSLGETDFNERGLPVGIRVLRSLPPQDKAAVKAHELAEAMMAYGGDLARRYIRPISRMEMRRVYNELGNPDRVRGGVRKDARPFTTQTAVIHRVMSFANTSSRQRAAI